MKKFQFISFCYFFIFSFTFYCYAENIKQPNVAGSFYPSDKKELSGLIEKYFNEAGEPKIEGDPFVLISPHAGYIYSGPVAAYGYKALKGKSFDTVVILAASHFYPYHGISVYKEGYFRTPLGDVEVDSGLADALMKSNPELLFFKPEYFQQEHSLEAQLPFLQKSLKPGFKIVPILIGDINYEECELLADYLAESLKGKNVLVVASTDLSHYKIYDEALIYDKKTVFFVENFDSKGLWDEVSATGWNVCGIRPVTTAIIYTKNIGANKAQVLKYANSGDTAGDKARVVGYMSAVISKITENRGGEMFTKDEKKRLLQIARQTLEARVSGKKIPVFQESVPALNVKRGAFVTLTKKGELGGCIGSFSSSEVLYKVISNMAIEASTNDFRFSPVKADELKDIVVEISVLSEPEFISDWKKIRLGVDGVIIRGSSSSGVFLPQVATETGWDLDTFLGQLCSQKAGLPWDFYKSPEAKIYIFQAEVFSEKE